MSITRDFDCFVYYASIAQEATSKIEEDTTEQNCLEGESFNSKEQLQFPSDLSV